ncbi:MAG: plastocyanin/azurin family copper-binding protein [Nitriliruptoraceae bacterium]
MAGGADTVELGAGKMLALVVAAVGFSIAAALVVATPDEPGTPAATVDGSSDGSAAESGTPVSEVADTGDGSVLPDLVPKSELALAPEEEVNVAAAPEMPPAATRSEPAIVDVEFEVVENVSTIDPASGTQHETWGYRVVGGDDQIVVGTPGPVIRARVGDVLRFTVTNPEGNQNPHNVDLHAVTGQGGGAEATTVAPGETRTIEARLLYPGFFMYHCAYGDVPSHISRGMVGGILVDPAEPLPDVDHEWYIVQSEYYLADDGEDVRGLDRASLTDEDPSHVVFNGAVGALTGDNALGMAVGERARIYFVNAGLNLISSFHPIGSHWDAVYPEAALLNPPIRGSQTTLIPAGGGTVVDLAAQVPQTVLLVDHALSRAFDKGAIGQIVITGDEDPEIFEEVDPDGTPGGETTEPEEAEQAPTDDGSGGDGAEHQIDILPGSGDFQDLDSPDEFATDEDPADYSVNVLEVEVGDTVTWTNDDDAMMHTVTADDGSFDSGLLDAGDSWSYTFTEAGEFEYFCSPHPWMRAKVVVTG